MKIAYWEYLYIAFVTHLLSNESDLPILKPLSETLFSWRNEGKDSQAERLAFSGKSFWKEEPSP